MIGDAIVIKTHVLDRAGRRKVKQELDLVVPMFDIVNKRMLKYLFSDSPWVIPYETAYNECLQTWISNCEWLAHNHKLQHVIVDTHWFSEMYKPRI